jgi:N-methylhydantoinase B
MTDTATLDVVSASILRAKLEAAVRDMATTLATTAHSSQLSTSRSFGCALLDADGSVVAIDEPLHLPSVQETSLQCLEYYRFDLASDDVIMANDPYSGGSSLHYFTLVAPFGHEDDTVAYLVTRVHMPDIGGVVMGNYYPLAWELWQEGNRFTPIKIIVDGKRRRNAVDTILLNGRDPEGFRGDLEATLATLNVGRDRLRSLIHDYGLGAITAAMSAGIDYSERVFRTSLLRIPDGSYSGAATLDHDGLGRENLQVKVTLERTGDGLRLDFTGTEPQSAGFVNSPPANTRAFALLPLFGLVDESVPRNSGLLRAVEVVTPEGTLVNPAYPAPTGWCHAHVGYEIAAAVGQALAAALPDEAGLAHASQPLAFTVAKRQRIGGVEEQLGRTDYGQLSASGANATSHGDGWGVPGAAARALLPSVEEWESGTGATIARLEYRTDSAGAGRFRGAPATETVIRVRPGSDERLYACVSGREHPPAGLSGGLAALGASLQLSADPDSTVHVQAVEIDRPLAGGVELTIVAAAGGGWGDPRDRDPDAVRADVRDGYVSPETAERVYGVAVDQAPVTAGEPATVNTDGEQGGGA